MSVRINLASFLAGKRLWFRFLACPKLRQNRTDTAKAAAIMFGILFLEHNGPQGQAIIVQSSRALETKATDSSKLETKKMLEPNQVEHIFSPDLNCSGYLDKALACRAGCVSTLLIVFPVLACHVQS